jgi:hypothetical protein
MLGPPPTCELRGRRVDRLLQLGQRVRSLIWLDADFPLTNAVLHPSRAGNKGDGLLTLELYGGVG